MLDEYSVGTVISILYCKCYSPWALVEFIQQTVSVLRRIAMPRLLAVVYLCWIMVYVLVHDIMDLNL